MCWFRGFYHGRSPHGAGGGGVFHSTSSKVKLMKSTHGSVALKQGVAKLNIAYLCCKYFIRVNMGYNHISLMVKHIKSTNYILAWVTMRNISWGYRWVFWVPRLTSMHFFIQKRVKNILVRAKYFLKMPKVWIVTCQFLSVSYELSKARL